MSLAAGTRLGVYEVTAPLGAGGMGEVYRARDTRLHRDVALKILPAAFARDRERLARFEREARTLAALNHPRIAHLYGVEEGTVAEGLSTRALVMELVEGEDLAERLARGPVPIDEALSIAAQVAEALEAAHGQGIIHRDLKPANIKLQPDGGVKLLDFGLAKALEGSSSGNTESLEDAPTITAPADVTLRGTVLGTAAYMAPEQARGRPVDKRADVWAFGVVLFELLARRRPFQGRDATEIVARILEREPDWSALPPATPVSVVRLLKRCLEKDPQRRLRDCGDAILDLTDRAELAEVTSRARSWSSHWAVAGGIGALVGAGIAIGGTAFRTDGLIPEPRVARFSVLGGPVGDRGTGAGRQSVVLSPDGRFIVYLAEQRLKVHSFDQLTTRPITGTEPVQTPAGPRANTGVAAEPIMSPDGTDVAYVQAGQLKRVSINGGNPSAICTCGDEIYGATWNADGGIYYGGPPGASTGGVWRVSAAGGVPERVVDVDPGHGVLRPQVLPDGEHVLFTVVKGFHWDQAAVYVQSLRSGERRMLIESGIDGRYVPTGHLIYGKDGVLNAVTFDPARLLVSGTPVPVLPGVAQQTSAGSWGGFDYDVAPDGSLVYVTAEAAASRRVLVWVDRDGGEEVLPAEPRAYQYPRVSPDGQKVALDMRDMQNDVWVWDLARSTLERLTVARYAGGAAIWSHDGRSILFGPDVDGTINLHQQDLSGGPVRRLTMGTEQQVVNFVTVDGQELVFEEIRPGTGSDLRILPLDGSSEPRDLIATRFNERNADGSPDGRWIAYQSDESGRFEVYVRPFPRVGDDRWQVSLNGGTRPLWSHDGRELFFLDQNRRMVTVTVDRTAALAFGRPVLLFDATPYGLYGQQRNFALAADGRRFLMVRVLPPPPDTPSVILIQNWFEELRAKVR